MALLNGDRFEGRFRDGVHVADTSDLMRRLVKEQLLTFDGTPLFPERLAATVSYRLSDPEARLYTQVTDYVRKEWNRADMLENEGRRGTVGFALSTLQRRLASSPEAIHQSLRRRRERLERRLQEERLLKRGAESRIDMTPVLPALTVEMLDDLDDAPEAEVEAMEEQIVDQATAARTIAELTQEIVTLQQLEALAQDVRRSGTDRKWEELSSLVQSNPRMFDGQGHHRKLIIFTEHRDTLTYLADHLRTLLGRPEAVVTIHGGMGREERRKTQEAFTQDKDVQILVATDAAGEGINLQRAHLMVNYDLPWNPNRLEQRFGRIHRIGQTEVCHLWNLVAEETREGDVFKRLFEKIEEQRQALGGGVFDILGKLFREQRLRDLLIDAIRYGDRPEVRARLLATVDNVAERERCRELLEERALARDAMDAAKARQIRTDMERAEAGRLQPHFIATFFREAFAHLGGSLREREPQRYEVTHVPVLIRSRDRLIGTGEPVLPRYERITFEKQLIIVPGKPVAAFVCPGHPLLDATIDLVLERYRDLLKRGAILVDLNDARADIRILSYLEHTIQDARSDRSGNRRVVSRQMQFIELNGQGQARMAGAAPYLDYRPLADDERRVVPAVMEQTCLQEDLEGQVLAYAVGELVPRHLANVRQRREELVAKIMAAVKDRLTKEIAYWDHRAEDLKAQEAAGRQPRMNWQRARQRADDLQARLQRRMVDGQVIYAALILLGTRQALGRYLAQTEVIFEYRSTEASGPPQQRQEYRQGFFLFQDDLWHTINLRNDVQHFQDGLFIWNVPTFSETVIREAILNTVSHRDYRLAGSVFVRQFPRQMEIVSPGGFPPGITVENILWRQSPRNRRIAEVFAKCGLVERSGQGINRMFEECIKESKPHPDFSGTDDYQVSVTLRGEVQDPRFLRFLEKIGQERVSSFTTRDMLVLGMVHRDQPVPEEFRPRLSFLMEQGVLERVGRGKYILSRQFYGFLGTKGIYTRKRGLDRGTNKALLLKHIRDNHREGSQLQELLQVLPALSRHQVQALLRELKGEELIHNVGRTKAAHWYPGTAPRGIASENDKYPGKTQL
jgi:predicted HTH transcriptional regulator